MEFRILALDLKKARSTIEEFLAGKLTETGQAGYVVGLSGGIDSAVSAALAVKAVGKEKLLAVLMPFKNSSSESVTDAMELVESLGIEHIRIDISPMIEAYFKLINQDIAPDITPEVALRAGNKMARERMSILFDYAQKTGRLVLGTGNRTEICLGYTTWYGDSACSLDPIGQLYKTEVRQLAVELGVPQSIRDKPPSADLWAGQTDEEEIGVTYDQIDGLLKRIIDDDEKSRAVLLSEGFADVDIERVISLTNINHFKRNMPEIPTLGRVDIPDKIEIGS